MSLTNGIKNCEAITDLLNNIITSTGQAIDIDNATIWRGFLHQPDVNNEFWEQTIQAMEMLERECRKNFKTFHREALWAARLALDQDRACHARCMDTKLNKGKTWRLIMSIREVINSINEVHIPNV
jgi:oligoendopeptidase F